MNTGVHFGLNNDFKRYTETNNLLKQNNIKKNEIGKQKQI